MGIDLTSLAGGLTIGIAVLGGALAMGMIFKAAIESIARQPEQANKVTITMFICFALVEAQVLYAFLITLIILFSKKG